MVFTESTHFEISKLQGDLVEFDEYIQSFDMDRVERQTLKESAKTLAEMVRQAIRAENKIESPARLNSIWEPGPGPSLVSHRAWRVIKDGNRYIVKPHPKVEQRATVLNSGYGEITPNSAPKLAFSVSNVPSQSSGSTEPHGLIRVDSVDGPDPTEYWQAAIRRFESTDEIERIALQELREEKFR